MNLRTCVIFGGTGCIGTHIAKHLLEHTQVERIYLADIRPLRNENHVKAVAALDRVGERRRRRVVYTYRAMCVCRWMRCRFRSRRT